MLRCNTCNRLDCYCSTRRPRIRGLRGEVIVVDEQVLDDDLATDQDAGTD